MRERTLSTTKHLLIGAAAGLAGAWAMNQFQRGWLKRCGGYPAVTSTRYPRSDEEVMRILASRAARALGATLSSEQRDLAASVLHYGFGATTGAAYAALAKENEWATSGFGSLFGSVFFAAGYVPAPEGLKPCLPTEERPGAASAAYEWLTHVVYGMAVEATRRAIVKATR